MASRVEKWAFMQNVRPAARKLVLVTLARYSNPKGQTHISQSAISISCGIGERMTKYHLTSLEKAGFISRRQRNTKNGRKTNLTQINFIDTPSATSCTLRQVQKTTVGAKCNPLHVLYSTTTNVSAYTNVLAFAHKGKKYVVGSRDD